MQYKGYRIAHYVRSWGISRMIRLFIESIHSWFQLWIITIWVTTRFRFDVRQSPTQRNLYCCEVGHGRLLRYPWALAVLLFTRLIISRTWSLCGWSGWYFRKASQAAMAPFESFLAISLTTPVL